MLVKLQELKAGSLLSHCSIMKIRILSISNTAVIYIRFLQRNMHACVLREKEKRCIWLEVDVGIDKQDRSA